MAKVAYIRSQPFGFIQQTLGHGQFSGTQIIEHGRQIGNAIPGHDGLPAEAELVSDLFPRHVFRSGQRFFLAWPERFRPRVIQDRDPLTTHTADRLPEP